MEFTVIKVSDLKAHTAYSVNSDLIQYALSFCLECKCVNGRCKDNVDGDGSCACDLGWRGINCAIGMILTFRTHAFTGSKYLDAFQQSVYINIL